jgi:hypothetical protein
MMRPSCHKVSTQRSALSFQPLRDLPYTVQCIIVQAAAWPGRLDADKFRVPEATIGPESSKRWLA